MRWFRISSVPVRDRRAGWTTTLRGSADSGGRPPAPEAVWLRLAASNERIRLLRLLLVGATGQPHPTYRLSSAGGKTTCMSYLLADLLAGLTTYASGAFRGDAAPDLD
jgi:hypothetical protein